MNDETVGYEPTPKDEAKAEKMMTNEMRVESNVLYETLKPFSKLDIPEDEMEIIGKHAQEAAKLAAAEYKENAEKVENSPGMKVLGALKRLESLEKYGEVCSVAAESIRDAAKTWEAELAAGEKLADAVGEKFDSVEYVKQHLGTSRGQINHTVRLFLIKTEDSQEIRDPKTENIVYDEGIINLLSKSLKAENIGGSGEAFLTGGELGSRPERRISYSETEHTAIQQYRGNRQYASPLYLQLCPKDLVFLVEALKAEK